MVARNKLLAAPPYPVEHALKVLGDNLRTARLRRNLTVEQVAERIGAGPRAITAAEKGKASTGISVFAALLWSYDLLDSFTELADPTADTEGLALAMTREPLRARSPSRERDDDF